MQVELARDVAVDFDALERFGVTTSSCGVCGKASIRNLQENLDERHIEYSKPSQNACERSFEEWRVDSKTIRALPQKLHEAQQVFSQTGGLHASALFARDGELRLLREDVGRHNALDKLVGARFLENKIPLCDGIVLLSGRVSFELVQKAVVAGVQFVAAIGAPSSLAVEVARRFDLTLVGFLRDDRFNIYSGEKRVRLD